MVSITNVRTSNATLKNGPSGLVAVFVGATSGIGLGTLKAFAKSTQEPTAYVVGRSKKAAAALLDELQKSNPQAKFHFIESEISLIKNVDAVCEEVKSKESKVDILFMSPGYLSFDGRTGESYDAKDLVGVRAEANSPTESPEGIDVPHALRLYSRLRFAYNLMPLLNASNTGARVISVLAGGQEKPLDVDDLEVCNDFTFIKAANNGTTQTTLALEELAKMNPSVTFIHKYPGFVNTGVIDRLLSTAPGLFWYPAAAVRWLVVPIANLFSMSVTEAGERGLFLSTSARYPPSSQTKAEQGYGIVPLPKGAVVAKSSVVHEDGTGNGVYRVGPTDDNAGDDKVLGPYRKDGTSTKVWESITTVWERAVARA
ncbi:hypothetical protein BP5796_08660 [Coleophoma crateriformis]|uniref:Uncharacterized protein n=1 Tax=Coleophoma crateriformis TaxID=565419 RepID=A0A3D8R892_9HELO|nr:hypothetical protein BP5796_08660 [Coleophoma crateriformis]